MKKMILSAAFMMAAFLSQAAVGRVPQAATLRVSTLIKMSVEDIAQPVHQDVLGLVSHSVHHDVQEPKDCSVTMKGTIDLGAFEAEISCTTSAATCQEATAMALSCIKAAVKTARTILL